MQPAELTIASKNYSSWSLQGWLLCKMAGLEFIENLIPIDDPSTKAELLLTSPSFLVPRLEHNGMSVWDTLAIAEYLAEAVPGNTLLPADLKARTHCRSICGEMHAGFANLRSSLPMNLKASHPAYSIWSGAQADIDRVSVIWRDCLANNGGPYLFGGLTMADAMFAPVCTRFTTYGVELGATCEAYRQRIMSLAPMQDWIAAAKAEPDALEELDVEF